MQHTTRTAAASIACAAFLSLARPVGAAQLVGVLDIAGDVTYGWALDAADQSQTISVALYLDGAWDSGGRFVGTAVANRARPDLNAAGYLGDHGFKFGMPAAYSDGRSHSLFAYALTVNGAGIALSSSPRPASLACSLLLCPSSLAIASNDGQVAVTSRGFLETVFHSVTDGCEDLDVPDVPARAFRDAAGRVNLVASHSVTYRSVGTTLSNVVHSCAPVMQSIADAQFDAHTYHEWLHGLYTADGSTIYALVHNEWYGTVAEPQRCPNPEDAWVNSITLAVSTDEGAHFTHPSLYNVRTPPTPWSSTFTCSATNPTAYGSFNPSNIIAKDGYFYAFFMSWPDPLGLTEWGMCVMRTTTLADSSSWLVWTSTKGWQPALSTPRCSAVALNTLGNTVVHSVTYNTYLGAYILIGRQYAPVSGVSYALSSDLLHWTVPTLLLSLPAAQGTFEYPSLLDPTDSSMSFEQTGQSPYLYLTHMRSGGDRDVVRQQIRFDRSDIMAPSAPASLAAVALSSTTVALQWAASTDNVGVRQYEVYRNNVRVATTTALNFVDNGLGPGKPYTYQVRALDFAGNISNWSDLVRIKTLR